MEHVTIVGGGHLEVISVKSGPVAGREKTVPGSAAMKVLPVDPPQTVLLNEEHADKELYRGTTQIYHIAEKLKLEGRDLPPAVISWQNLTYSLPLVEDPRPPTYWTALQHRIMPGKFKKSEVRALDSLNGYLRPGMLCVVFGAPGAGKSSLLRILSGRTEGMHGTVDGTITVNGKPRDKNDGAVAVYVEPEDHHFPLLTVRETVLFSARCRPSLGLSAKELEEKTDSILKFLGLSHVANTIVGNQQVRGVSGGERRRVSVAVEAVMGGSLMFLDEPSMGLDATATYELMRNLRAVCDSGRGCMVALLQPSYEAYCMADHVMMMDRGKVCYFGPGRDAPLSYFQRLGYVCPDYMHTADFLQAVLVPQIANDFFRRSPGKQPLLATEWPKVFEESELGVRFLQDAQCALEGCKQKGRRVSVQDVRCPPKMIGNVLYKTRLCLQRQIIMEGRNIQNLRSRFMQFLVLGFIVGTLFVNLPDTFAAGRTKLAVIFQTAVLCGFSVLRVMPEIGAQIAMFRLQRQGHYFNTISYFLSVKMLELVLHFIDVVLYSTIVYWSVGFSGADNGQRFLTWIFTTWMTIMASSTFIQILGYSSPDVQAAASIAGILQFVFVAFCGFLVPKIEIPDNWIFMYYLTYLRYPVEALSINELWDAELTSPPGATGVDILEAFGMRTTPDWIWKDIGILISFWAAFNIAAFVALHFIRPVAKLTPIKPMEVAETESWKTDVDGVLFHATPSSIVWKDLHYSVPGSKKGEKIGLLNGVDGCVTSGSMVALMGPSGAGKTTLLDVLSNRKTGGETTGDLFINGQPRDRYFLRVSGYVEQFDLMPPTSTVREALVFSAMLRLPSSFSKEQKVEFADRVLHRLELSNVAHYMIGIGDASLPFETRKRVMIGIELVAQPSILFLDEPTSGLDAVASQLIMKTVKKLAQDGLAVICTIHQPSSELFSLFDYLLLLQTGGNVAYFGPMGPGSQTLVSYFDNLGFKCPPRRNPADFVLDIIKRKVPSDQFPDVATSFNPAEEFRKSAHFQDAQARINEVLEHPAPMHHFRTKYASNIYVQIGECARRAFWASFRNPLMFKAIWAGHLGVALIAGTLWYKMPLTSNGAMLRASLLNFMMAYWGLGAIGAIGQHSFDREIYYRERSQQTYRPASQFIGKLLAELPSSTLAVFLFGTITYALANLSWWDAGQRYAFFLLILLTYQETMQAMMHMLAMVLPNAMIASMVGPGLLGLFSLFSGFLIPVNSMPRAWFWMYYLTLQHYPLESLLVNEVRGQVYSCPPEDQVMGQCAFSSGEELLATFDFYEYNMWPNFGYMLCYLFGFRLIALFAQYKICYLKR